MVKKSKLLAALDAHKGRDYDAEKRKKKLKAGNKARDEKIARKEQRALEEDESQDEDASFVSARSTAKDDVAGSNDVGEELTTTANGHAEDESADQKEEEEEDDELEEDGEDVALSDLSEEDLEDTVPHQRLTINNGPAIIASTSRISLLRKHPLKDKAPFSAHNSLTSTLPPVSTVVPDANDDLIREQEFYKIARAAALEARTLLKKENIPFARPSDYFAEMVKSEGHMERIHKKQYDEAAERKGREEARRLRDAKKFGKQTQIAKEQERAKQKRDTLDKIKDLKRKRKGNPSEDTREAAEDLFDVGVEAAPNRDRSGRERGGGGPNAKRQKKDSKFGFGGKKRFSKSGDAESSADMRGFSSARMKGKGVGGAKKRPGKARRAAGR